MMFEFTLDISPYSVICDRPRVCNLVFVFVH
jgi:hypothetical protein